MELLIFCFNSLSQLQAAGTISIFNFFVYIATKLLEIILILECNAHLPWKETSSWLNSSVFFASSSSRSFIFSWSWSLSSFWLILHSSVLWSLILLYSLDPLSKESLSVVVKLFELIELLASLKQELLVAVDSSISLNCSLRLEFSSFNCLSRMLRYFLPGFLKLMLDIALALSLSRDNKRGLIPS